MLCAAVRYMKPAPPVTRILFGSYDGRPVDPDVVAWLPFIVATVDGPLSDEEAEAAGGEVEAAVGMGGEGEAAVR